MGCVLLMLQGCATVSNPDARDPWESMNRSVYKFNDALDNVAIQPAAKAYVAVLPSPVRTGIHNFLGNIGDVWSMANSALQLKGQATAETFMRITVNTFLGLGGVLDVAQRRLGSDLGLLGGQIWALRGAAHFWTVYLA
jgi:phospholipid-binding lipoprotein MlaA